MSTYLGRFKERKNESLILVVQETRESGTLGIKTGCPHGVGYYYLGYFNLPKVGTFHSP